MAKTAKLKKSAKSNSIHSRAAKRACSPTLNLDKSLTNIRAPVQSTKERSVLTVQHGGVTKRKAKGKPLSRQQRIRHEKGSAMAEAVMDKTEKKVEKSLWKGRNVKERSTTWEDLNSRIPKRKAKPDNKASIKNDDDDMWEDTESDGNTTPLESVASPAYLMVEKVARHLPKGTGVEDEIL